MNELRPLVGVGVIIKKDDKILLGKRLSGHGAGTYQLPGGHLEFNESFEACAEREALEETGLVVKVNSLISVNNDTSYGKHYVTIGTLADWISGEPDAKEAGRAAEWGWVDPHKLPEPMFLHSKKNIDNWLAGTIYSP